eukprot:TRINITY_DN16668_c0_g3_i1.p1 TRINITY_DN16668_c0_g3~~TRINITY_DN16668_c0_g3_i1.p1  ORF type:complete len:473 (-),score=113.69 TRINITY_DN16668_c0_g3_i1:110-1528(-)
MVREVEDFISANNQVLNDEARAIFRNMSSDDQRRVMAEGPMEMYLDALVMFRVRATSGKNRELELAAKKCADSRDFEDQASLQQVADFISDNQEYLDEVAQREFKAMSPEDQWRIIQEGPVKMHMDPVFVINHRVERSKDLCDSVTSLFASKRTENEKLSKAKAKAKPIFDPRLSAHVQDFMATCIPGAVPAAQMRCGGFANAAVDDDKPPPVGKVKGIDGVVEILKNKYSCQKGQRFKVIGETGGPAGNWRLEEGKTVPKLHWKEGGWKWVLETEEAVPEVKKPKAKAAPTAPPPAAKAQAKKKSVSKSRSRSPSRKKRNPSKKRSLSRRSRSNDSEDSVADKRRAAPSKKSKGAKKVQKSEDDRSDSESNFKRKGKKGEERNGRSKQKTKAKRSRDDSREACSRSDEMGSDEGSRDRNKRGRSRRNNKKEGRSAKRRSDSSSVDARRPKRKAGRSPCSDRSDSRASRRKR